MAAPSDSIVDLATIDKPIGDFLSLSGDIWPIDDAMMTKYRLTDEQLAQYDRDGFIDNISALCDEQVARLRDALKELSDESHPKAALWHEFHANEAPSDSGMVLFHALGAWRISEAFHDLLFHPGLLVPAMQVMGKDRVRFWHDQLFCKPAATGGCVAWHQDMSYWLRTSPVNHMTVHVALDAQDEANGALHYVPGSHRWPLLPITSKHFDDMESIRTVLDEAQVAQFDKQRCVKLSAGQASFHHALCVHGSFGNTSDRPRRATVVNLFGDGTICNTDKGALLDGVPVVPLGETLDGIFFPLLASLPDGCSLGAIPDCAAPFECKATGEWAVDEAAADAEAPAAASGAT